MNAARMLLQIRNALGNLNPNEVRELARRPVSIELSASDAQRHEEMANYFAPAHFHILEASPVSSMSRNRIRIRA